MTNVEEEDEASDVSKNQSSTKGTSATMESTRLSRTTNSTKSYKLRRAESSPQTRKRKGKVGDAHITKEQSLFKTVPRRRILTLSQQDQGSEIDFEKRDQLALRDFQEPKRKRSREATGNVESQLKILTKSRKVTKPKSRFSPKLTNVREGNSTQGQSKENPTDAVRSTGSSETEKNKPKLHQKRSLNSRKVSSQHVKTKARKKTINVRRRSHEKALENIWPRQRSLREKYRAGNLGTIAKKLNPNLFTGELSKSTRLVGVSQALHSLRKPTMPIIVNKLVSNNVRMLETRGVKAQTGGIQEGNDNLDLNICETKIEIQSNETATALKLANDTSGFVRTTLKAVENSKNANLNFREGISKRVKEDVNMVGHPNTTLSKVATRYKSTLKSLESKRPMTAEKLIQELGALRLASKRSVTKTEKLGKRHINRSTRTQDETIGEDIVKETVQDVIKDRKSDTGHIKLGRKTRKSIENQMKKFGLIDKAPQIEKLTASAPTKKSRTPVVSGFDRLVAGAGGNKEFEMALAQIVTSLDDELGWTKEQEKALQKAYVSIKQTDGCFWQLISKEVPGRSAKECYNKFYSRHPTPFAEPQQPALLHPNEMEYPFARSDSSAAKSQLTSPKVTRKQKQLEAQKTIRNILGHADAREGYHTDSSTLRSIDVAMEKDVESMLDRGEDEKAVILQFNPPKDYDSVSLPSRVEESSLNSATNSFFDNVVLTGVSTSSDKENNQPRN